MLLNVLHNDENGNRFLYITKKRLGENGDEITPTAGDLRDETQGCVVNYEPQHGYVFSNHEGDKLVSSAAEANVLLSKYCLRKANRYTTLVARSPKNGHEIILDTQTIPAPYAPYSFFTVAAWSMLLASVIIWMLTRRSIRHVRALEQEKLARRATRIPRYSRW